MARSGHPYQCTACDKTFASFAACEQHYDAVHLSKDILYKCSACDKPFVTEAGREQHFRAVHVRKCSACDKSFVSDAAREQHFHAVHVQKELRYKCTACDKPFATKAACEQHYDAVHMSDEDDDDEEDMPDPPVDTPGRWVSPDEFKGRKSFGYFTCDCGKWWMSAHSFPQYTQGCKGCNRESLPVWLWINDERKKVSDVEVIKHRGPHDAARCGACHAGVCDVINHRH